MNAKNLPQKLLTGCFALACALAFNVASAQAVQTPDQISARYDAQIKHCDSMQGNDKDVCKKEAKANRDSAKADAKANKEKAEANHDAVKEKRDAAYDVAKEKCDAMSGDAKDQCIAQAKTKYGK